MASILNVPQTLVIIDFRRVLCYLELVYNFTNLKNLSMFVMFNGTKAIKLIYINKH